MAKSYSFEIGEGIDLEYGFKFRPVGFNSGK